MTTADFPNYADDNAGATAASIREAADAPNSHTATINALVNDLANDRQNVQSAIEGDVADIASANPAAAGQTAQNLARNGYYAIGLINQFADAVEAYDNTVDQLNEELRDNTYQRYQAQNNTSADNSEPGSGGGNDDDLSYDEIKAQEKAKLQGRFNTAVSTLDTAEGTAVTGFQAGPPTAADVKALVLAGYIPLGAATLWPGLTLTTDEQRQALGNMTDEEQAEYVRTHPDIPPEVATVISAAAQRQLAQGVANDIQDREVDDETVRILDLFKEQSAFAGALYTDVTPDEMADAIRTLNFEAFPMAGGMNGTDGDKIELYDKFMNAAGIALATHSRTTSDPTGLAEQWYDAITSDDPSDQHNAAALTLLMREGGEHKEGVFGTTFMDKLATDLYEWERREGEDGPVWGPRNIDGITDPDATERNGMYFGRLASDGLANILGAMGHSPDAAQAFFQDDDGNIRSDMLDYLIGKKDGDDVDGRTFSFADSSDEGDGLGEALAAAGLGGDDRFAAELTTDVFSRIADLSGHDPTSLHDTGWHVWEGMTDSLGELASGYTGDIYELMRNSQPDSDPGLDLDPGQMAKVLGEIGSSDNKDGLTLLTAAMMTEVNHQTGEFLDDLDGPKTLAALQEAGFSGLQTQHGNVMGNLLRYGLSVSAEGDELEQQQQEVMSRALDVVTGFVPGGGTVLGEGSSQLAQMTFDTLKGQAIEQLKSGLEATPTTDGYLDQATGSIDDKITYGAMNVLAQHGYLGPQDIPNHSDRFPGVPPEIMVGNPPQIRPDLYDADGYVLNDPSLSDAEREKIQSAWNDFQDAAGNELLTDLTYQSSFMSTFIDPTIQVGG